MDIVSVFALILITTLAGAIFMSRLFHRMAHPWLLGGLVGAGVGVLGGGLFMAPLGFCTFEADRGQVDHIFGVILIFLGAFLVMWVAQWLARYGLARDKQLRARIMGAQTTQGIFRTSVAVPALLLAPTLVILLLFLYYPSLDTFSLSTQLAQLGNPRTIPVCLDNFTRLIVNRRGEFITDYLETIGISFFIAGGIVLIGLALALAIAYLAYQQVRGAAIYRTLLVWPYAISPAVAGIIFFVLFDPVAGLINHIIKLLGGVGPEWIKDNTLAPWTIIIASVWKTLGYNILFYIAGLQNVSKELVEAAAIDGANAWQRFRNVVLPSLSPITFFLIITNITYAFFDIFGTIDFLTRGGPAGRTSVMIYDIYETGIVEFDLGKAAARSIVLFLIVIGITYLQFRTSGRRVSYGA